MATKDQIADTLDGLQHELARRITDLEKTKEMTANASTCIAGILEGMASVSEAFRKCNGRPSLSPMAKLAAKQAAKKKKKHG